MERLTESNPSWIDDELWERACEPDCEEIDAVYRKLKDYEDLEEQGLLLKLPCKVGDAVYEITGATVRSYDWKYLTYENAYVHGTVFNLYRIYDIGKTIFLTREEAEKKLEELRGGRK